jgi:hypothetical protein
VVSEVGSRVQTFLSAPPKRRLLDVVTVLGFGVPALAYLSLVGRYTVNVPILDEWLDVSLVEKSMTGHLTLASLWAQHNQNRMLFPNLLVVLLGYSTHFDIRVETYFSALLLFTSIGILIWMHRRRTPATPLFWYCPVAILMLSWVQYENTLWGFQMAWFLVLICLVGTLAIMDRPQLTARLALFGGAVAVIGSYSSIQGLIIWPSVFVLLLYRRRSRRLLAAWVGAAVLTTALYLYNINPSQFSNFRINPLLHPLFEVKLFLFSLGNVAGKPITINTFFVPQSDHPVLGTANPWLIVFGVVIVLISVFAVVKVGIRGSEHSAAPVGVSLILFAFTFDAVTAIGRGRDGYAAVSPSHYATYNLLALVGSYLVIIDRPLFRQADQTSLRAAPIKTQGHAASAARPRPVWALLLRALVPAVLMSVFLATLFGYSNGLTGGRAYHSKSEQALHEIHRYQTHEETKLPSDFLLLGATPKLINLGQREGLSPFNIH